MCDCLCRYVGVEGEKKPDGWGEMEYQDGSRYTGQWDRGVRAGCGVFIKKGFLSTRHPRPKHKLASENTRLGDQVL